MTTTIEVHDDAHDCVTVLQIPEPLWLFTDLLFRARMIDQREDEPVDGSPIVGTCHVLDDKIVLRYHGGEPAAAQEWCEILEEEEECDDEVCDEEEDADWWKR